VKTVRSKIVHLRIVRLKIGRPKIGRLRIVRLSIGPRIQDAEASSRLPWSLPLVSRFTELERPGPDDGAVLPGQQDFRLAGDVRSSEEAAIQD
jgi:hypothetical protein